jgi:APA family basic amino acid/polyamine antiporter
VIAPLSMIGCVVLFFYLPPEAKLVFPVWSAIGLVFYFAYGFRKSQLAKGYVEVPEAAGDAPPPVVVDPK